MMFLDDAMVFHGGWGGAIPVYQESHPNKKLNKVAGTQQIGREWLQLKKFLFHNWRRKAQTIRRF